MSLERKDIRTKVYSDVHDCLKAIVETEGKTIEAFVEELLVQEVDRRIHQASMLAARASAVGRKPRGRD
jgi:hypothetical protein